MLPVDQEQVGEGCTRRRRIAADEQVLLFGGKPFEPGWWKGAAQMMQSLVFGVGGYDTCD